MNTEKENMRSGMNRHEEKRSIKYESFKMEGNELIRDHHYNVIKMEEMSGIPDRYEILKI